jgi:hypothetical protein
MCIQAKKINVDIPNTDENIDTLSCNLSSYFVQNSVVSVLFPS